jgi:hypothetical protein
MTDLYLYDDVFAQIMLYNINLKTILSVISTSHLMKSHLIRIISGIKVPTSRQIRDIDYLMFLVKMFTTKSSPKDVIKFIHNKAIREGYFPIIRDFALFSRKMKMTEFMDIMTDVPPSDPKAYYTHIITKSNKIKIAEFIRDSVRDGKKYITTMSNNDFSIIEVAYNLLTNTGNIDAGKFHERKLAIMFANCSDEVIQKYFGKKKSYEMNKCAAIFGRDTLYVHDANFCNFGLSFVKNDIFKTHVYDIETDLIDDDYYVVECDILTLGLKMYSREKIVEYLQKSRIYSNQSDVFEILVRLYDYELIKIFLSETIGTNIANFVKLSKVSKKYFDIISLQMVCEKVEWAEPLTMKSFEMFKKKVEKMNLF